MKFCKESGRRKFVNHLGLKLQKRKEERKQKKNKKKSNQGSYDGQQQQQLKNSQLNKKGQKSKNQKVGKGKHVDKSHNRIQDTGGFQITSSNSDRLARLQEFVNQEVGKIQQVKDVKSAASSKSPVESKEGNLIKNKQKLQSLRRDQAEDTKEINRLARNLGLRASMKAKVAPIFADDFGDILADIDEGTMNRAKEYSDKNELKKSLWFDSDSEVSSESENSEDEITGSLTAVKNKNRNKKKGNMLNSYQSDGDDDNVGFSKSGHKQKLKQNGISDMEKNDFDSREPIDSMEEDDSDYLSHSEEEDSDSNEERRKGGGFFDSEAEESDGEESNNEELIHDDTKEYELAFEGGGTFINNGVLDDIDQYSSNSGDDTDLEDFIVDDEHVEHETEEDDLLEKADKILMAREKKNKNKRKRIVSIETDSEHTTGPESDGEPLKSIIISDNENCSTVRGRKRRKLQVVSDSDVDPSSPVKKRKNESSSVANRNTSDSVYDNISYEEKENDVNVQPVPRKKKKKKKTSSSEDFVGIGDSASDAIQKPTAIPVSDETLSSLSLPDQIANEEGEETDIRRDYPTLEKKKKKKKKKKGHAISTENCVGTDDSTCDVNQNQSAITGNGECQSELAPAEQIASGKCNETDNVGDHELSIKKKKKKKTKKLSSNCSNENEVGDCTKENHLNPLCKDKCSDNFTEVTGDSFNTDGVQEDIYGRLRDREGNVIEEKTQVQGKYIPPALRKLMALSVSEKKKEELASLKRKLKGLINRLAESNIAGIASQIEGLYSKHSQNDMNECLTNLLFESLVLPTLTPERLVQEHMLLIAVLTANIGSQVGAHILTEFVIKLHEKMEDKATEIDCKEYDNIMLVVASLFNFRVVAARLVYDILQRLADIFTEKEVELILMVLRTVGFPLRKEDPQMLKTFITQIQSQAAQHQANNSPNYTRIAFMLEVINSIKNNNPSKVPNYDPTHVEHLKKIMKGLVHKGKNLTPLYVTLDDIIKSKSQGRWWVVGSAWSGGLKENNPLPEDPVVQSRKPACMEDEFSEHFKKKAAKLQVTRPPRINIMYIITEGSEDYLDAFDKLLQLKLPPNQEQDMFSVIVLCCQKGKVYNEFFSYLACRMCKFNKKYSRQLQFVLWDKFQEMENFKSREVENLAKFLVHLIGEGALNITVLKNLSFLEAEAQTIEFVRIILKDLMLDPGGSEKLTVIFSKISGQSELNFFCQSLKIFISKFLVSKKKKDKPQYKLLYDRSQEVLELLSLRSGVVL